MSATRQLGDTGIAVSPVGLGGGQLGLDSVTEADAERLLHGAVDLGVALIDTARSYGSSEDRIGRHLGARRRRVALSTKIGYGVDGVDDWTAAAIAGGVDAALRRLRTDVIDVVHLHSCPLEVLERDDIRRALGDAVAAGKVRAAGYSGDNAELRWAVGCGSFAVVETSFNACDQGAAPVIASTSLGVIAKRPLANAPWRYRERPVGAEADVYWQRLEQLGLADVAGELSLHELAIRFAAHGAGVDAAIVGTASLEHLRENLELAARGPLPPEIGAAIAGAWARAGGDWAAKI